MKKIDRYNRTILSEMVRTAAKEFSLELPDYAYIRLMKNGGYNSIVERVMSELSDSDVNKILETEKPENFYNKVRKKIAINEGATDVVKSAINVISVPTKQVLLKVGVSRVNPIHQTFVGAPIRMSTPTTKGNELDEAIQVNVNELILKKVYEVAFGAAFSEANLLFNAASYATRKFHPNGISNMPIFSGIGSFFNRFALQNTNTPFVGNIVNRVRNNVIRANALNLGWGPLLVRTGFAEGAIRKYKVLIAKKYAKEKAAKIAFTHSLKATFRAAKVAVKAAALPLLIEGIVELFVEIGIDYLIRRGINAFVDKMTTCSAEKIQELYNTWALDPSAKFLDYAIVYASGRSLRDLIISLAAQKHLIYALSVRDLMESQSITGGVVDTAATNLNQIQDVEVKKEHLIREMESLNSGNSEEDSERIFYIDAKCTKILGYKWIYHKLFGLALRPENPVNLYRNEAEDDENKNDNINILKDQICVRHGFTIYGEYTEGATKRVVTKVVNVIGNETRNFDREFKSADVQLSHDGIDVSGVLSSEGLDTDNIEEFVKKLNEIAKDSGITYVAMKDAKNPLDIKRELISGLKTIGGMAIQPWTAPAMLVTLPYDAIRASTDLINLGTKPETMDAIYKDGRFNSMLGKNVGVFKYYDENGEEYTAYRTEDGSIYCSYQKNGATFWNLLEESECAKKIRIQNTENGESEEEQFWREFGYNYSGLNNKKVTFSKRDEIWKYVNSLVFGNDYKCKDLSELPFVREDGVNRAFMRRRSIMRGTVYVSGATAVFLENLLTPEMNEELAVKWYKYLANKDKKVMATNNLESKKESFSWKVFQNAEIVWPYTETYGYRTTDSQLTDVSTPATNLEDEVEVVGKMPEKYKTTQNNSKSKINEEESVADTENSEQNKETDASQNVNTNTTVSGNERKYQNRSTYRLEEDNNGYTQAVINGIRFYVYVISEKKYIIYQTWIFVLNSDYTYSPINDNNMSVYYDSNNVGYIKVGDKYFDNVGNTYMMGSNGVLSKIGADGAVLDKKTPEHSGKTYPLYAIKQAISNEMKFNTDEYYKFIARIAYIACLGDTDEKFKALFKSYAWPGFKYFYDRGETDTLIENNIIDAKIITTEKEYFGNEIVKGNL